MMEKTDWKVDVTLDRERLVQDIDHLVRVLARQRIQLIVSASDEEEAIREARERLRRFFDLREEHIRALHPRRLA